MTVYIVTKSHYSLFNGAGNPTTSERNRKMDLLKENTLLRKQLIQLMEKNVNPPLNEQHARAIYHLSKISKRSKYYKNAIDAIGELK